MEDKENAYLENNPMEMFELINILTQKKKDVLNNIPKFPEDNMTPQQVYEEGFSDGSLVAINWIIEKIRI